jgi:hypothetical protein
MKSPKDNRMGLLESLWEFSGIREDLSRPATDLLDCKV